MKNVKNIYLFILLLMTASCFDSSKPNYQFFPQMYDAVGYDTYSESDAFSNGIEAQLPVEGTISRGWKPYEYEDTNEGYEEAKLNLMSPIVLGLHPVAIIIFLEEISSEVVFTKNSLSIFFGYARCL